eukprot:Clim_evm4s36 gene=Clim_evmTU4s36
MLNTVCTSTNPLLSSNVGSVWQLTREFASESHCLDGSQAALFHDLAVFEKAGTVPNCAVVYLNSGGACYDKEECESTLADPNYRDLTSSAEFESVHNVSWLLSGNVDENPDLFCCLHISVPYCTQDFFLGNTTYEGDNGQTRYFGGQNLVTTALRLAYDAVGASNIDDSDTRILLAGSSAGAIGAMNHAKNPVLQGHKVALYLDSGDFLDSKLPSLDQNDLAPGYRGMTELIDPFLNMVGFKMSCQQTASEDSYGSECIEQEYMISLLEQSHPIFVLQSRFDTFQNFVYLEMYAKEKLGRNPEGSNRNDFHSASIGTDGTAAQALQLFNTQDG